MKTARMMAERGGHMRKISGRVLEVSMLPPGVNANEIR
jgi:hypothetical protein